MVVPVFISIYPSILKAVSRYIDRTQVYHPKLIHTRCIRVGVWLWRQIPCQPQLGRLRHHALPQRHWQVWLPFHLGSGHPCSRWWQGIKFKPFDGATCDLINLLLWRCPTTVTTAPRSQGTISPPTWSSAWARVWWTTPSRFRSAGMQHHFVLMKANCAKTC